MKVHFEPATGVTLPQLVRALRAQPGVTSLGQHLEQRWYLETFDARLAAAKQVLSIARGPHNATEIRLRTLASEATECLTSAQALPKFAHDFRPGRVALRLAQITLGRALLPLAVGKLKVVRLRWQDARGKLLAALQLEVGRGRQPPIILRVSPLRGFEHTTQCALLPFLELGLVVPIKTDAAEHLLQRLGLLRAPYTCKPVIPLRPKLPAAPALAQVLSAYTTSLRANEWGVVADIDLEFLHDYRVILRCLRAWLSDLKTSLARKPREVLRVGLATLNRLTGELRDLDVLTGQLGSYLAHCADLPSPTTANEQLRARLETARANAQTALAAHLKSAAYRNFQRRWVGFLTAVAAGKHAGRDSEMPIRALVRRAISKRHARILAFDPALVDADPSALHELRKDCKRLRYLLEGFQLLFARNTVRQAVKELKNLQGTLGDTWDLHVHLELLSRLGAELPATVPLMSALTQRLSLLEGQQEALVVAALERFRSQQAQRHYARLAGKTA